MRRRYIALVTFAVLLVSCSRDQSFEAKLEAVVSRGPGTEFELTDLTDFRWTTVYIFGPYATPAHVEETVGFKCCTAEVASLSEGKSNCLFVFVFEGAAVRCSFARRRSADFERTNGPGGISFSDARFQVYEEAGRTRVRHIRSRVAA